MVAWGMAKRFRGAREGRPHGKVKHVTGLAAMRAMNPKLAGPLERALRALTDKDLPTALRHFGDCAEIDPTNKAVLHFGAEAIQRAYFNLRHQDPQPPADKLRQWRDIALTITRANFEAFPTDSVACHNVGKFIQDDGDEAGSIPWYRNALHLKRDQVETWGNLGTALYGIGEIAEAERCWSKCVAFEAENPSGSLAQSYIWLRRGDFARGWPAMNARWLDTTFQATYGREDLHGKPWTGQPLKRGDSLLLHGEQGLGDHVQFARYVPLLQARGIRIAALETRPPLVAWFEACLPGIPIIARDTLLPNYTHHAPLMSLPGLLGITDTGTPPLAPESLKRRISVDVSPFMARPAEPLDHETMLDGIAHEMMGFETLGEATASASGGLDQTSAPHGSPRGDLSSMLRSVYGCTPIRDSELPTGLRTGRSTAETPSTQIERSPGVVPEIPIILPDGAFRASLGTRSDSASYPSHRVNVAHCDRGGKRATLGKRIGLAWFGTVGNPNDAVRSIPHEDLSPLADLPGITWVPLQYDPSGQADLYARAWLGQHVESVSYRNVLDLAQVMAGLDLIVSVDSLPLHVAGSLGLPTIALLRYACDWRWGMRDAWHPWYPNQTNLIQDRPNDWSDVIQTLRDRLVSGSTTRDSNRPLSAASSAP